jgi:hypothetical protein
MEDRNRPLVEGGGSRTIKEVLMEYLQGHKRELVTSMGELFHGALAPVITEVTRSKTIGRVAPSVDSEDMMRELEAYELAGPVPPKKTLSRPGWIRCASLSGRGRQRATYRG